MPAVANVRIHSTQFPQEVRRALVESLRRREINHKFLYDSLKQTNKWLALHQAYSPSRADADCGACYDASFAAGVKRTEADAIHLIGLGCGGGQKDSRLLKKLVSNSLRVSTKIQETDPSPRPSPLPKGRGRIIGSPGAGRQIYYTPLDVSVAMVLEARRSALEVIPPENCFPLVCDLAEADDLTAEFKKQVPGASRVFTFFGMLPNFEPQTILPRLASVVREGDVLLVSANLAPGTDYGAGVAGILPLYDNELTRDWLMGFLLDLGFQSEEGELRFEIEDDSGADGAKRIVARFYLRRGCEIAIETERFRFDAGESIRVFFSYRYTPTMVEALLNRHRLRCREHWITRSGEEGVFFVEPG